MDNNSGTTGNFIQRYLMQDPYSPGSYAQSHPRDVSMQDLRDIQYSPSRTLECQKLMDRISTFASKDNLVQRVAFLDQELSVYGYPRVASDLTDGYGSSSPPSGDIDLVTLVNISYDLLQCWKQAIACQGESNDLQRTSESEIGRLRHLNSRLKEDLMNKDRDMKSKELIELQLTQRQESLKKKLKVELDKSKRLSGEMAARDTQFIHEKKKKVHENEKLQARLQQLLQDKRQERMLGIEILNSLQRSDGKRGKWSTDKSKKSNEQDMYRLIITNYEDAQKQLLKENEGMRRYLKEMQSELVSALNERNAHNERNVHDLSHPPMQEKLEGQDEAGNQPSSRSSSQASNRSEPSDVSEQLSDGTFDMPYDLVKEDIERSIRTKWKALKKEMKKSRKTDKSKQSNKENFGNTEYDDLVQQQQELIDYLTTGEGESSSRPIPEDCYFLEEKAELEKQRNLLQQQKQTFEKEHQVYAQASVLLDKQRRGFETEKHNWFQQNFLQLTPFRNESRRFISSHQNLRRNEPSVHHGKERHQPSFKTSDFSGNHQSQDSIQSPNNINHSLSLLHSSSQHASLSPDNIQTRGSESSSSNRTPENLPRSKPPTLKTAPTQTDPAEPPTTAELYRTLGLVYYGSDKENESVGNTGNKPQVRRSETNAVCSKSSHQSLQRSSNQGHISSQRFGGQLLRSNPEGHDSMLNTQGQLPRSLPEALKVKFPDQQRSGSPEFLSATASLDSEDESISSDYYDAEKMFRDGALKRGQRSIPRENSNEQLQVIAENWVEAVSYMKDEFQMSENLPEIGSRFEYTPPERGKLYASKSVDDKTLKYSAQEEENNKQKKSGIRGFVRNFILGSPKPEHVVDENNSDKASLKLVSTSDSLLSRYYLDKDLESGLPPGLHPSTGPKILENRPPEGYLPNSSCYGSSRQRTRSFPGSRMLGNDCSLPRSYSCDAPVLSAAAERHKSALLSMSANMKPKDTNPVKYYQDFESLEKKHLRLFKCRPTTCLSEIDFHRFKLDEKQFNAQIYEEWSHSSLGSSTVPASQIHPKPAETGFSQLKPSQAVQSSDSCDVLDLESSSSSRSKPVSTVPSGHSLLEQIVGQQSFSSTTDEDQSNPRIEVTVHSC